MEIRIVQNVLEKNKKIAHQVREKLVSKGWSMFNFMSSPGSGKTTLLENLIPILKERGIRPGVIEGDVATLNDSLRLQKLNIPISHITTEKFGGTCHLAANVIIEALKLLEEEVLDTVFIENVGNLICPGEYDTGSDAAIVLISVTEGEDKPLKYPSIFRKSHLAIINKIDIAEAVEADVSLLESNLRSVNPAIEVLRVSAKRGSGLNNVADWIQDRHQKRRSRSG